MRSFMTLRPAKYQLGCESSRKRWVGNMACEGENKDVCRILDGKPEGKRPLGRWSCVKCVYGHWSSYVAVCRLLQHVVWLLFASLCSFLITQRVFNILLCFFCSVFCFLFYVLWVVFFCVLFLLLYTAVSFLFLYKSTDHCHKMETHL
jgi:hypothetical protein